LAKTHRHGRKIHANAGVRIFKGTADDFSGSANEAWEKGSGAEKNHRTGGYKL
jgi:hypothetical protein